MRVHISSCLIPHEPSSYTSNGRSVWDSKEASVWGRVQRPWGIREPEPYIFHRSALGYIGVGKYTDLWVR